MIQERKNDMASIIKRKKNYSVVYNYVDEELRRRLETKLIIAILDFDLN